MRKTLIRHLRTTASPAAARVKARRPGEDPQIPVPPAKAPNTPSSRPTPQCPVIPAKAGIQLSFPVTTARSGTPAFAGVTNGGE